MTTQVAKEVLTELSQKYPTIEKIHITFEGSGDSFEDFYDFDIEYIDPKKNIECDKPIGKEIFRFLEDIIWELIEDSGADFNDDGSRGTIEISLKSKNIKVKTYERYTEERLAGEASLTRRE